MLHTSRQCQKTESERVRPAKFSGNNLPTSCCFVMKHNLKVSFEPSQLKAFLSNFLASLEVIPVDQLLPHAQKPSQPQLIAANEEPLDFSKTLRNHEDNPLQITLF